MAITRAQFIKLQQDYQTMFTQLKEARDRLNSVQAQETAIKAEIQLLQEGLTAKQLEIRNADVGNS